MKRLIILAIAMAFAPVADAQLYKYVDKNGKTVYSDQPPADVDSKQISVSGGNAPGAPQKSAVERDKELDKARKKLTDDGRKSGEDAEKQAQAERRCAGLRENYQMYSDGGRIAKINEKGERDMMTDAEIEQARERTRREMDEACKK